MSEPTRGLRAIVLAAIILCIVASMVGARAQDKGLRIGVVSPGRLLTEYKFAKSSREELQKMQDEFNLTMQTWDHYHMLSPTDQDILTKLTLKEATDPNGMTKAEKEQKKSLE